MIENRFGIVLFVFAFLLSGSLLSQDEWEQRANRADSLRRSGSFEKSLPLYHKVLDEIPASQMDDQSKYQIRIGLSYFMLGKNEQAEHWYKTVLVETEKDKKNIFRGHAFNNLGLLFQNIGDLQKARKNYDQAFEVYKSLDEDFLSDIAQMNIGKVLHEKGNYKDAVEYLTRSAKTFEKRGNNAQLGEIYSTLGLIQESLGDLNKAKKLHRLSIQFREKVGEPYDLASSYNNIGWVFKETRQLDSAKFFYNRALNLMNGKGDRNLGIVYHNLASVYEYEENWVKSEQFLQKALRVKKSIGDSSEIFISLTALAHILNIQGALEQSRTYLKKCRDYARNSDSKKILKDFHTEWKIYYSGLNMSDSALFHYEEATRLEHELFQEKYTRELAMYQESLEADHREHVIGELGKENKQQTGIIEKNEVSISMLMWISSIAIISCFMIVLIFIIFRQDFKKKLLESQKKILESEKKSLESHLNGIEEEKKRVSRELHDASGSNLRNLAGDLMELVNISKGEIQEQLEKLYQRTESTMEEIVMISHDLHHPRIENSVFSLLVEDHLYDWLENKPYTYTESITSINALNPLSLNAKSHIFRFIQETLINIQRHSNAQSIHFDVQTDDQTITLSIKDNGNEFDTNGKNGIGHKNLEDRAKLMDGIFTFKTTNEGSSSTLIIPISSNLA